MLNQSLLNDCEEFLELVENNQENSELETAIESVRRFLEHDVDGWTNFSEPELARAVQCRLAEIWKLIPRSEKKNNPNLHDYYDQIKEQVAEISEYENDDEFDVEEDD